MMRAIAMLVAVVCYAAFFASFLYLIGFVAGFDALPSHVDKGRDLAPGAAVAVNLALIALFGVQHSVMARQGFKRAWTRLVPPPVERSVYCLASAAVLVVLFAFWAPIGGSVWSVENPAVRMVIWSVFFAGWTILLVSTFLINHFELFGLAQAWRHFRGGEAQPPRLTFPLFYKWVRHPLYTGFVIAFWATPDMTYSHLLLAVGFTIYVLVGIAHEEKDLVAHFGDQYLDYRRRVGSLIPGVGKRA